MQVHKYSKEPVHKAMFCKNQKLITACIRTWSEERIHCDVERLQHIIGGTGLGGVCMETHITTPLLQGGSWSATLYTEAGPQWHFQELGVS